MIAVISFVRSVGAGIAGAALPLFLVDPALAWRVLMGGVGLYAASLACAFVWFATGGRE